MGDLCRSCGEVSKVPTSSGACGIMGRTQRRGFAVRRRIDPRREDGVAMTEFAIIAPVFMLLVVGMLVFGRLFFYWIEANHVANETARWAVVDHNPYEPGARRSRQHAQEAARPRSSSDNAVVCIEFPDADPGEPRRSTRTPEVGQRVRVQVELPVSVRRVLRLRRDAPRHVDDADRADRRHGRPDPRTIRRGCEHRDVHVNRACRTSAAASSRSRRS